jgi:hypothetical protein
MRGPDCPIARNITNSGRLKVHIQYCPICLKWQEQQTQRGKTDQSHFGIGSKLKGDKVLGP